MVPKPFFARDVPELSFRAVLFRMVPKQKTKFQDYLNSFRAVLFRMVPKQI